MKLRMIHTGRTVPKQLQKQGWKEVPGAMHHGAGIWTIPLERETDSQWCAWCGAWGDHTSGGCQDLKKYLGVTPKKEKP